MNLNLLFVVASAADPHAAAAQPVDAQTPPVTEAQSQGQSESESDDAPAPAAATTAIVDDAWQARVRGHYRLSGEAYSAMRIDAAGDELGQTSVYTHRLRVMPELHLGKTLSLTGELQVLSGHLGGSSVGPGLSGLGFPRDPASAGAGDAFGDQVAIRKLNVRWLTPVGALIAGRMASDWGLGMLVNSGDRELEDWSAPRMGTDRNYGDIVDRVIFATRPLQMMSSDPWAERWMLAVGGDVVERDERTVREEGDFAAEGIALLRYERPAKAGEPGRDFGIYAAYRNATDRNDDILKVWVLDVSGKGEWRVSDVAVRAGAELAWVRGDTTLGRTASTAQDILEVGQLGYVLRAGAEYLPLSLGGDLEFGYASGDSNPYDRNVRNFSFDPDFNPSLILFDQLRAAETLATARNVGDPARVGRPPETARLLPSNGAVSNAIYLRPTIRWHLEERLKARVAALFAWAEEDMVDVFNTTITSVPQNHQGGPASERGLGVELNVGVDYSERFSDWLKVDIGIQGGYFFPGAAFNDATGKAPAPIGLVFGRLGLSLLPPET